MEEATDLGVQLHGPITALVLDADGRISSATETAARMLGVTPEELQGRTLGDLVAEQWRAMADSATARILCGDHRAFQLLLRGTRGRQLLVQLASRRINRNVRTSYVVEWTEHHVHASPSSAEADAAELRRLATGLLSAQETERKRVALMLDSGVAPLVVVARFMLDDSLQRLGSAAPAESIELLRGASARLHQALRELQGLATDLRPRMLDDLGLLPTIEWLCRRSMQANRALRVDQQLSVSEMDIPEHLKLAMFRLVEEGLANVAQHANASEAQVALAWANDELLLWVQDNGVGFDAPASGGGVQPPRGIGLASVRNRIEATGGRVSLQSSKGHGTRLGAAWTLPRRF